jgi:hypothetical protein
MVGAWKEPTAAAGIDSSKRSGQYPPDIAGGIRPEKSSNARKLHVFRPGTIRAIDPFDATASVASKGFHRNDPGVRTMPLLKILALGSSSLLGLALTAMIPAEPPQGPDEPPKAKKKEDKGPGGEMKKAYDLLRRLRSDNRNTGRPEERLNDWTERATKLYRDALRAAGKGEHHKAREYGVAAHDLARAVDHARNAATFDLDDDLPPPPDAGGPEDEDERNRRDLRHAYDRISDLKDESEGPETKFYLDAFRDLYNAARRDAVAGRRERAGELARAAEALTHVPEHLARALELDDRPEPKEKKAKKDRPEPPKPEEKRRRPDPGGQIPPPLD